MKIKFVPQDLWVGLYWKVETSRQSKTFPRGGFDVVVSSDIQITTWYLCIIPCFPIIWQTTYPPEF